CRGSTPTAATFSTGCGEAPARLAVFPARGRGRRPAAAQVRHPPAGARDRDPRARPGRPEVAPPRHRARAADPGGGAPRPPPRPAGPIVTIPNGADFEDFEGLAYHPADRFRITHVGSFFGKRDPRPFLSALAESELDVVARFVGDFRSADRDWAELLELGDRLELHPYVTRRRALELQRDSEALLLLIPDAGGRGRGVVTGK